MASVLIIDDDDMMNRALARVVERLGHEAACAFSVKEGLDIVRAGDVDVVFLDVCLPDGSGLDALPAIRETASKPEVIIITGFGDQQGAELAIKNGAWDYIQKPCATRDMTLPLMRALDYRKALVKSTAVHVLHRDGIIGAGPAVTAALEQLALAAATDMPVLLHGETGTGKELFARAIHDNSPRSDHPFVIVDCAALPDSLVENLLFGHEKGAYTGADGRKDGLILQADKGTLFLDEIGELPFSVQKNLLRVIQDRHFRPVGSNRLEKSDFRLIAATNRNLDRMVREASFRQDLLYRIQGFTIELPPLRERGEDLRALLTHFIDKMCKDYGTFTKGVSPEFIEALAAYDWPGNVREFIHAVEEALARAGDQPVLYPVHLPQRMRIKITQNAITAPEPAPVQDQTVAPGVSSDADPFPSFRESRAAMEVHYLQQLMKRVRGNRKEAVRVSGLSRTRLFELLKKHGVS